jgi:hypothetical protein
MMAGRPFFGEKTWGRRFFIEREKDPSFSNGYGVWRVIRYQSPVPGSQYQIKLHVCYVQYPVGALQTEQMLKP